MLRECARRAVQNEFKSIIEKEVLELMNLEIFQCSPEGSFETANMRMPLFGIEEPLPSDPPTPWNVFMFKFEDVFIFKNLELLAKDENPDDSAVDQDLISAYNSLIAYIVEKDTHDICLSKVCKAKDGMVPEMSSKTDIAYALAVHLFAPLGGGLCVLDNRSVASPKSCPGGCKRTMQKGPTGIGAMQIWNGFADIFIDQKIPVKIWKEIPEIITDECEEDNDSISDSVSLSGCPTCSSESDFYKHNMDNKSQLCQLIAQTITNSFAQVNKNKQLSPYIIPSFGCSNNRMIIFGYDSEGDVMVKKIDPILLWTCTDNIWHLSVSAVVQIWMYIHFQLLMLPSIAERFETNIKSNFHRMHTIQCFRKYAKCQTRFPPEGSVKLLHTHYSIPTKKMKTN
ncbi:uncharacterized protein LOC117317282 [Pecten maximus]|uniref:uncharacterized protein LOC117317282 n=1 Tax=Pecten maximus TaxID=6579 RepID=UPI001457E624|nr:uncharacterized protein LOC117317282 [Pecten maximus]